LPIRTSARALRPTLNMRSKLFDCCSARTNKTQLESIRYQVCLGKTTSKFTHRHWTRLAMKQSELCTALRAVYAAAPVNDTDAPQRETSGGESRVSIAVLANHFHCAGALHGSAYFKMFGGEMAYSCAQRLCLRKRRGTGAPSDYQTFRLNLAVRSYIGIALRKWNLKTRFAQLPGDGSTQFMRAWHNVEHGFQEHTHFKAELAPSARLSPTTSEGLIHYKTLLQFGMEKRCASHGSVDFKKEMLMFAFV